jgi:uncharacterized DUF497 family protein
VFNHDSVADSTSGMCLRHCLDNAIPARYDTALLFEKGQFERAEDIVEDRFITVGYSPQGRLLAVLHTERGDAIRIISARPATISERKRHEK